MRQTSSGEEKEGEDIVVLAAAEYGMGKVLAIGDTDFLIAGNDRFGDHEGFLPFRHNRQLALNMFDWIGEKNTTPADYDNDGVPDSSDHCVNPGCKPVDSRGCPKDSDNDGLNDCEDRCPTVWGTPANYGCSAGDRDNDGIPEEQDACNNPDCSAVDSQGCPKDTDGDEMNDCEDNCPSEYGKNNDGCPEQMGEKDSDNDGIPDEQDGCFNPECLRVDSQGCPRDSDNDGVNDCEDQCLNQPGIQANNGCPGQQTGPTFCLGTVLLSIMVISGAIIMRMKLK